MHLAAMGPSVCPDASRRGKTSPPRQVLTVTSAPDGIRATANNRLGVRIAPADRDEWGGAAAGPRCGLVLVLARVTALKRRVSPTGPTAAE